MDITFIFHYVAIQMALNDTCLSSHSFYMLETQQQLSWVVLAQGLSGGCSWDVGQGCNPPDQGLLSFQGARSKYWLVVTSGLDSSPGLTDNLRTWQLASSQSERVQEKASNNAMYFMT